MVKIIHKNIYSKRLTIIEEIEPYVYEIQDEFTINSFMIFLSKFKDRALLAQSIEDFCETKRYFISEYTKRHIINNVDYNEGYLAYDLNKLLNDYGINDILDFLDICINNLSRQIQKYNQLSIDLPYQYDDSDIYRYTYFKTNFINSLNEVFEHNNLGYEVLNDIIVTKQSDYLHIEAIGKPLTLLINEEFNGPLKEFETAIDNYTYKNYENTVIEGCKAFESTMKAVLDKLEVEYNHDKPAANDFSKLGKTFLEKGSDPWKNM